MEKTSYQRPEIRDSNDNVIQEGTYGKNSAFANAQNTGILDYINNNLEAHETQINLLLEATGQSDISNIANTINELSNKLVTKADKDALNQIGRQVSANRELLLGTNARYETDSTEAYTKQILSGAKIFDIKKLQSGKSVVVNQLQQMRMGTTSNNGITFTVNADKTEITISGTATGLAFVSEGIDVIKDHKYFVKGCAKGGSTSTYMSYIVNSSMFNTSNAYYDVGNGNLITCLQSGKANYVYARVESGVTVNNLVFKPQCIDLTKMFGTGNEPTLEQCREIFSADYYSYNEGTLLSVPVEQVVVRGKNIFDKAKYPITKGLWINATQGTDSSSASYQCTMDYVPCTYMQGKSIVVAPLTSGSNPAIAFYDSDKHFLSAVKNNGDTSKAISGNPITVPANASYLRFSTDVDSEPYIVITNNVNVSYSPYKEEIIPIPASAKTDGLSAGTVANYVDFERKKFVQRVGRVDLGTLNGFRDTAKFYFAFTDIPNLKLAQSYNSKENLLCSLYSVDSANNVNDRVNDMTISSHPTANRVWIADSRYTTFEALKSALSGVYLYYELATPIETDIDIDNRFEAILCEGNGSITFENNSDYNLPVMNEEEFLVKLSEV